MQATLTSSSMTMLSQMSDPLLPLIVPATTICYPLNPYLKICRRQITINSYLRRKHHPQQYSPRLLEVRLCFLSNLFYSWFCAIWPAVHCNDKEDYRCDIKKQTDWNDQRQDLQGHETACTLREGSTVNKSILIVKYYTYQEDLLFQPGGGARRPFLIAVVLLSLAPPLLSSNLSFSKCLRYWW